MTLSQDYNMCALLVWRIENLNSIKRAGFAQLGKEK